MQNTKATEFKLVGFSKFIRNNPETDQFPIKHFHHIEFWCIGATNLARRFTCGLAGNQMSHTATIPTFDHSLARSFSASYGLAVRAIAIEVDNAVSAFYVSVAHGAKPSSSPIHLDENVVISEVHLYGDVVLRYISFRSKDLKNSLFLPGFENIVKLSSPQELDFGIRRLDHVVGNVANLSEAVTYVKKFTGLHEYAEFIAEDLGKTESGLNSVILSSNNEIILLGLNEPVYGTQRKSKIQTFLEHNEGAGVQHLALTTDDIFTTLKEMPRRSGVGGGFEFMAPVTKPGGHLKSRAGDVLSDEMIRECEEMGILVDRDAHGDRPILFIEIIQRVGCILKDEQGRPFQKAGCGAFGKGNVAELFKSVEEYEKTLEAKVNPRIAAC
ncbi:4-hydroxyphenylpyruvate dioxygenase [Ranunculus cassubicifolius]